MPRDALIAPIAPPLPPDTGCLPRGYRLRDFVIERVLAEGGFGVVYVAIDARLQRRVAIKEYMPASLARRSGDMSVQPRSSVQMQDAFAVGLRSFINEARILAGFDHPALVRVLQFWEDKGTGFMVMPLYQAPTARQWTLARSAAPDAAWLSVFLDRLLEALDLVHGVACLHRDIAPDNILLQRDRDPLLLDFGAARRVIEELTQTLTAIVKPGFAPVEQYAQSGGLRQGPWTDLYALCATVHFMLTRRPPPPAVGRTVADDYVPLAQALHGRYPMTLLAALDAGLAVRPADRPQSVAEFRALLNTGSAFVPSDDASDVSSLSAPATPEPTESSSPAVREGEHVATAGLPHQPTAEPGLQALVAGSVAPVGPHALAELLFRRPLPPRAAIVTLVLAVLASTAWFWPRSEVPLRANAHLSVQSVAQPELTPIPIKRPTVIAAGEASAPATSEGEHATDLAEQLPVPRSADRVEAASISVPADSTAKAEAVVARPSAQRIAELARLRQSAARRTEFSMNSAAGNPGAQSPGPAEKVAASAPTPAPVPPPVATTPSVGAEAARTSLPMHPGEVEVPTDRLLAVDQPLPQFPIAASRDGVHQGRVIARLHVAADGRVGKVEIVEASPRRIFDRAVLGAAGRWRYQPPGQPRQVDVEFMFRHDG